MTSLEVWEDIGYQGDLEKIEKEYLDTIELSDGFLDFMERVHGKYKLAIISNDSSRWSRYLREKFDINKYFDVISISGDLKIKKPDERIFSLTIEKLGLKAKDCIYIVDIYETPTPYEGLGFANITIKAHYPLEDEWLQALKQVSMELPVCLMTDESAIFVKEESIMQIGQIYRLEKGEIMPLTQEQLERMRK